MTPGARAAAAIGLLDAVLAGEPAERALTRWARASRFAGSGDRAAVRDLVFGALRCRRSHLALSGQVAETGRALVLGGIVESGGDPDTLFSGAGHAPPPLDATERAALAAAPARDDLPDAQRLDIPDWLEPQFRAALGDDFTTVMEISRQRAPVFLRVNRARGAVAPAIAALAADGVTAVPGPLVETCLQVVRGAARVKTAAAYRDGLVELQDAASQAAVAALPLAGARRVLDYCAGGGGKVLAMAGLHPDATYVAHDADPRRMADLPDRAARAGAAVALRDTAGLAAEPPFDLVLLDVPCSGSGTWRRAPEAKWRLTPEALSALVATQASILAGGAARVGPGGALAYTTCSLFAAENQAQVAAFLAARPGWRQETERLFTPSDGGDGFFVAVLRQVATG